MKLATKTLAAIDKAIEAQNTKLHRNHLGASVIGRDCARQLWYGFRWTKAVKHPARLLRLFNRGHREEERIHQWLRDAGIEVIDIDPETGKQFTFAEHGSHYGGSSDGFVYNVPDAPSSNKWGKLECKTHNAKSFAKLQKEGVQNAKYEHYVQCQQYMRKWGCEFTLYVGVNKDTDELHLEIILFDQEIADRYMERALRIIASEEPPAKIHPSPAWYQCKFCDYNDVCHHGAAVLVNCRTCCHATAEVDGGGGWRCTFYSKYLNAEQQAKACASHVFNPHLVVQATGAEWLGGDREDNYAEYRLPNGTHIKNGPTHIPSSKLWKAVTIK